MDHVLLCNDPMEVTRSKSNWYRKKYTHDVRAEDALILDPRDSIPLNKHYCQSTAKRIPAEESVGQGGVNQRCQSGEAAHPPATSRSVAGIVWIFNMDEKGRNLG
jgi:hypothetical protein